MKVLKNNPLNTHPLDSIRIVIAEDSPLYQVNLSKTVESMGYHPILVNDGQALLDLLNEELPDLILLDLMMPKINGLQVLKQMRQQGLLDIVPVIVVSSIESKRSIVACIRIGAVDYLVKPFDRGLLRARIQASLELKQSRDHKKQYYDLMEGFNDLLEKRVQKQVHEITQSHLSTIFAMSKLAESRDNDTGKHLERIREYCKTLCWALCEQEKYQSVITEQYIEDIYIASPLHDIGKIAIPDHVLQKKEKLTGEEWEIMRQHTLIGANTLRDVLKQHANNNFIQLGIEIAENHHEKWDGSGYPAGRKGEEIPLSGRVIALADVYDALTSERCYKERFSHAKSRMVLLEGRGVHFDPDVVNAFLECEGCFVEIRDKFQDTNS